MSSLEKWIPSWKFTKKALSIMLPVVFGQVLLTAVYFLDNFMVGPSEGENAIGAVGIANEVVFVVMAFILGLTLLVDIFAAQLFGAKKIDKFKETVKIKLSIGLFLSILTLVFVLIFTRPILLIFDLQNNSPDIIDIAVPYLQLMMVSVVIYASSSAYLSSLTIMGKTRYSLYVAGASLVFNALFNWIFIYLFKMGTVGAAYSTIGARLLEAVIIFFFVLKYKKNFNFGFAFWRIDPQLLKDVLKKITVLISVVLMNIGYVAQTIIWTNYYGEEATKAVGFGYAISGIMWTVIPGISTSVKVLIGQKLGANKLQEAKIDSQKLLIVSVVMSVLMILITIPIGIFLPEAIGLGPAAARIAESMVLAFALTFMLFALVAYCFANLEAGGKTALSSMFERYFALFVAIPFAWALAAFTNLSMNTVFLLTQLLLGSIVLIAFPAYLRRKWLVNVIDNKVVKQL